MTIVSSLTVPVAQILVRNIVIKYSSYAEAGYWQAVMRVSDAYLMIVTTSFSVYYLPKLSSLKTQSEIGNEIRSGYKLILPFVFASSLLIYLGRFFIIRILYSQQFGAMEAFFGPQLFGDFFKIASWILGYLMVAKSMTLAFVASELFFSTSYVLLSLFFVSRTGSIGAAYAFAVNYAVYFCFMIFVFRSLLFTIARKQD
jgi:PST family polysaccharide transporter